MGAVQLVIFALIGTLTVNANPYWGKTTQAPQRTYGNYRYNGYNWYLPTTQPVVKTTQAPVTTPEPVPEDTFEQFKNQIPSAEELKSLYIDAEKLTKEQIEYINQVLIPALEKTAKDMPTVINDIAQEGIVDINAFNLEMTTRLENAIENLRNLDFEAIKAETIENVQAIGPQSAKFIKELPQNAKQMGTEFANQIPSQVEIQNNLNQYSQDLDQFTKETQDSVARTSKQYRKKVSKKIRKLERNLTNQIDVFNQSLNSTISKALELQQEKTAEYIQKRDQIKQEAKELVARLREESNNKINNLSTKTNEAIAESLEKIRNEKANLKQQLCDYQRQIHERLSMNPKLANLKLDIEC